MITDSVKFVILVVGLLTVAISSMQQSSIGQETKDFFALSCSNITGQVNELLESKGPVQRNMIDLKNMTFLMNLYGVKCS